MTSGDVFDTLTDREAGGLQYLEEKFPEKRLLLPKDLLQRAHIYQVFKFLSFSYLTVFYHWLQNQSLSLLRLEFTNLLNYFAGGVSDIS
jgi:hypothetical protein